MNNQIEIYLLTLVGFLVGTSQFVIAGILDKISNTYGISIATAGQLVTVFAMASGIGTPLLIMYLARYGLKTQLLIVLSIFLVSTLMTPFAFDFKFLMLARIIAGLATSTFVVISYTLAAKLAKVGRQGSAMANIALGFSLSLVFGVPFGRIVTLQYNWQAIFWILGAGVLVGTALIIWLIPNLFDREPLPMKEQMALFKKPQVFMTLFVTFMVFIGYSMISTYITPLLLSIGNVTEHQIAMAFLALGIASVVGSKLGASMADRIGIAPILFGSMGIMILSLGTIPIFATSLLLMVLMLIFWTASTWMFGPTQSLNLSTIAPEASSTLIGLNSSFVQLGFAAGAGIGGIVIHTWSVMAINWISAVSVICATGIALFSLRFSKSAEIQKTMEV
ncbi:MAG: MFS transporter [Thiovulaceae bacterium]|nr:MFS transporter [Sulfurimonadaceae bacterium]